MNYLNEEKKCRATARTTTNAKGAGVVEPASGRRRASVGRPTVSHLELVPCDADLRAEELLYDADGVTVAVESIDGVLKVRVQDGPEGEPVMFDLHSVTPMFLDWIVKAERATAHRQEHDGDWALWDAIGHMLTRLFPDRHPEAF